MQCEKLPYKLESHRFGQYTISLSYADFSIHVFRQFIGSSDMQGGLEGNIIYKLCRLLNCLNANELILEY